MTKTIWTTPKDRDRLREFLENPVTRPDERERPHLRDLARELERAEVFEDAGEVPPDLITMRSRVRLANLSTGSELECTLVYPEESDASRARISVLAPLGTAMLGLRAGDTFEVRLPRGETQFRVEEILYQPEAAGDFHL